MIIPPNSIRSFGSATSFRSTITITILVVRLSRIAERINVMNVMRHSKARLLLVEIQIRGAESRFDAPS